MLSLVQSFPDLRHKPLLVDMIAEAGNKTKVLYASIAGEHYLEIKDTKKNPILSFDQIFSLIVAGFHAIDMETGSVLDLYVPSSARSGITPHAIIALPRPGTMELLLCYDSQSILTIHVS